MVTFTFTYMYVVCAACRSVAVQVRADDRVERLARAAPDRVREFLEPRRRSAARAEADTAPVCELLESSCTR